MSIIYKYKFTFIISILILYLSLMKTPKVSISLVNIPYFDKYIHAIMYATLSYTMAVETKIKNKLIKILPIFLISTTFGGVVEVLQYYNPPRTASLGDLIADAIGSALPLACLTIYYLSYDRQQKREDKGDADSSHTT